MEVPPRSQNATCCGNESLFCKWIFPRVQAMTIRSGQITSRYSLQLIKHSSHYLRSQTARDQDLVQNRVSSGMDWVSTWNRSAVVVIASDSRAIVEIELCLFDVLVYAQISYVRVQAPHFAQPRPASPREHDACHWARGAKSHKERTICQGGTGGRGCANLFITRQIGRCTRRRTLHQYRRRTFTHIELAIADDSNQFW